MSRQTHRVSNRKRLSQNFLARPSTARMIARSARIGADDLVVEIGPGDGMLTRHLLDRARRVVAYEKDHYFARRLRRRYDDDARLQCVNVDVRDARPPGEPFTVVANIPYSLSTECLHWCLAARHLTSATLVTQLEFARKHTGDFGRWSKLTVAQWPVWDFSLGPRIGRHHFRPVPRVDSAVVHLVRRSEPLLTPQTIRRYRRLVELGFSGVGGSLHASLRQAVGAKAASRSCDAAGIAHDLPVGYVSPDAWLRLFRSLH